jgi:hypothetical protein
VLVLGFANLVADAISMGFGDIVSASSERDVIIEDVIIEERRVTEWDILNRRGNEQRELVRYYQSLGMDYNDATAICIYVSIFVLYNC